MEFTQRQSRIIMWFLVLVIIALGAQLYRTQKKLNDFAEDVEFRSRFLGFGSRDIQLYIDGMNAMKNDTSLEHNERLYEMYGKDIAGPAYYRMFSMATSVNDVGSNQDTLNKLTHEYSIAIRDIQTFYIVHETYAELKAGEFDQLIMYYERLKAVTEKFEEMPLEI